VLPQEELVAPTGAATMGFDRPGSGIEERPMSDTDRAPLAWENQLFGPPSTSRQRGMAAFDRWKRATVAISISAELWARRKAEVSALPPRLNELVHRTVFPTHDTARHAIAEYIEVFYSRTRIHSALGYRTLYEITTEYQQPPSLAA